MCRANVDPTAPKPIIPHWPLADDFINDPSPDVGQLLESACVQESQPLLVETHEPQECGVQIPHGYRITSGAQREVICLAEGGAGFHIPACHPRHHPVVIVISTWLISDHVVLERSASHFR